MNSPKYNQLKYVNLLVVEELPPEGGSAAKKEKIRADFNPDTPEGKAHRKLLDSLFYARYQLAEKSRGIAGR